MNYVIFPVGSVGSFLRKRGEMLTVTFEFLYGFGRGGNVLLQRALKARTTAKPQQLLI